MHLLRYIPFVFVVLAWVLVSVLVLYYDPESIIAFFGTENAYSLIFILALISGVSIFGTLPYHLVLLALASGGMNPWLLGLVATCGVMIGDSVSYVVGYHSRVVIPERFHHVVDRVSAFLLRHPRRIPFILFLYGALVPFSNDFVGISAGVLRLPYLRIMVPLGLGNLFFNTTLALAAPSVAALLVWIWGM